MMVEDHFRAMIPIRRQNEKLGEAMLDGFVEQVEALDAAMPPEIGKEFDRIAGEDCARWALNGSATRSRVPIGWVYLPRLPPPAIIGKG